MPNLERLQELRQKLNPQAKIPKQEPQTNQKEILQTLQKIEKKLSFSRDEETKQIISALDTIRQGIKDIPQPKQPVVKTQTVKFPDEIKAVVDQKLKIDFEDIKTKLKINQVRPFNFPEIQKVLSADPMERQADIVRDANGRVSQMRYIFDTYDITYTFARNRQGDISGYVLRKNVR